YMNATIITKEKNEVKFKMEFTAEEFEQAVIKAYQESKDKFTVDGFRKGKAPRKVIETRYGSEVFFDDAVDKLFSSEYTKAIDQLELDVIDRPRVELGKLETGQGFEATITVEVYPEFTVKDYMGVSIERIEERVEDAQVEEEMKKLQQRNSRMISVERPVKEGDMVVLDYQGFVGEDTFEGGTAERYPLKVGSNTFIPGFEEQLVGVELGSDVEVKVTFPEEYHAEDLAGKEAVFQCHIHEIKEEEVPELNDEFAKDVSEWDTLEDLKKETKENLEKTAKAKSEDMMKNRVLEKIYEANEIDVPNAMVEEEMDAMMNEFDQQLKHQGLDLQKYFQYLNKDPGEFRQEIKEDAFKRVKTRMIIGKIAELEKIEATAEELDSQFELLGMQYQMDKEKVKELLGEGNTKLFEKDIQMKKAVELVYEKAQITG
ncbi:MAG: trigger factor, partial [Clostridia bacterium]|nr:trigger factor [Clostridia bacterium]